MIYVYIYIHVLLLFFGQKSFLAAFLLLARFLMFKGGKIHVFFVNSFLSQLCLGIKGRTFSTRNLHPFLLRSYGGWTGCTQKDTHTNRQTLGLINWIVPVGWFSKKTGLKQTKILHGKCNNLEIYLIWISRSISPSQ